MELENMKAIWSEMSEQLEKQQKLTDGIIIKMAKEKSSSRLNRIIWMEMVGSIVSGFILVYLLTNFNKLDNWLNITGGIGSALILLLSIIMGIYIIRNAQKVDVVNNSYTEAIHHFHYLKSILRLYKKLAIAINVIFPFFLLPVVFKLFFDQDLLTDFPAFGYSLLLCFLLTPIVLYGLFRYYGRNVSQIREALRDLEGKSD